jgi:O-succinylbenzoic acid--CoA ligase
MLYINPFEKLPVAQSQYEQMAIDFCKKWQAGESIFTLHTSGSTGIPKPIQLTRYQMQQSALLTGQTFGLQQGDHILVCVNIAYIAGVMMLVRGLELGLAMTVVEPASNPFVGIEHLECQYDFVALVPLQIQKILESDVIYRQKLNQMKAVIVGGASVNNTLQQQIQELSVPVYSTYGMTETVSHIAIRRLNGPEPNANFRVLEGVEVKIDERSCLCIKAPASNNQWIVTNDVVELLDASHFCIIGRYDNIINSGGVKIQLEKVEAVLEVALRNVLSTKLLPRFFAYGIPDDRLGQQLIVVIELPQLPEEKRNRILGFLQEKLGKYEIPKQILIISAFSETPTGKIDKRTTIKSLNL